jgi:hypothetical protein
MKTWAIYIVAALGFAIYGAATNVDRDDSGAIIGEGRVDAYQVRAGDCFNDSYGSGGGQFEVSNVPGVPCSDPHDNEAYAVFDLAIESYPEEEVMGELAYESCMSRFEPFVGRDYETSTLEITTMYPSPLSWSQNDREVVCAVYDVTTSKLVGSARGQGL